MACTCSVKLKRVGMNEEEEEEEVGLGPLVRYTRRLGRKRIGISSNETTEEEEEYLPPLLKRQCSERMIDNDDDFNEKKSALESLPQDVLIRIICGVNHEDLKQLFNVSKSIRDATVVAKQMHFAYTTPTKIKAFPTPIDFEELEEMEAPNAPRQWRRSLRQIDTKKLADISVALFA